MEDDQQELGYGRSILWFPSQELPPGAEVAVSGADGDLVALATYDAARRLLRPRQVFFAKPESDAG